MAKTIRRVFVLLAAFGLAAALSLTTALWVDHRAATELPAPTGPYAVGRSVEVWRDARHELLAWIWYPADARAGAVAAEYMPAKWRQALERDRGNFNSNWLTRDLSRVRGHSLRDAQISAREPSYPLLILRGGASAEVVHYSTLAEDLASHGYIVVGFDAPYRTNVVAFPDGRVMERQPENNPERCIERADADKDQCVKELLAAWGSDIAFTLDRWQTSPFAGKADLTRVGVFGHSFGGATAAQFCREDARCKAGVDIDGIPFGSVVKDGLRQPFMFLLSDQIGGSDPEARDVAKRIQAIYQGLPEEGRLRVMIRGANHFLFSDDGALLKSHPVMNLLRLVRILKIEGRRQLAVTSYCLRRFFDTYLKGPGRQRLTLASPQYPEIRSLD